jgi:hypothetical protein
VTGVDAPEGTRFQLDPSLTEADFQACGLAPEAKIPLSKFRAVAAPAAPA